MKSVAYVYAIVITALALWAWYIDIKFVHSTAEHMLPDIVLAIASQPMSLTLGPMYSHWTNIFNKPFVQLIWLTFCGATQVAIVFMLSWFISKKHNHA